jgi:predicted nuclease with RNAse H fold
MVIVGLDLAGVETRPTGFCLLDGMKAETSLLYTNEEVLSKTFDSKPQVVAIDAPLSLPLGRKSIEDRTGTHFRECDRELLKIGIKIFPITLGPMRKLTQRGIQLREILESRGFAVLEVYPGGAQDVLGLPRKQKGLEKLRVGLEKMGLKGLTNQMSDHELDAVTCAFVGKLFLEEKTVTYGSPHRELVMPKKIADLENCGFRFSKFFV